MANLNGQNIGTNYKGIINIGSTINQNVSASLQSLTDGDGNNLPIQISTSQIIIGGGSSTGRFVVRGDGTNPIARFENNAGAESVSVSSTGLLVANSGLFVNLSAGIAFSGSTGSITVSSGLLYQTAINGGYQSGHIFRAISNNTYTNTSGNAYNAQFTIGFNPTSGTGNYTTLHLNYTVNQTGGANGITRGIHINPTIIAAADYRAIDVETGKIFFKNLPTTNPGVAGQLWNDGGTLKVS